MVTSDRWIIVRSRVSLAGRVWIAGGGIARGGVLNLTAAPGAARRKAGSSPNASVRHYDTRVRGDGFYFFLNLQAGDYVLDGEDEHGDEIEAQRVSIPPADDAGRLRVVGIDLSASRKPGEHEQLPEAKVSAAPARRRRGSTSGSV